MTLPAASRAGYKKFQMVLTRAQLGSGETLYLLGHSTGGWSPDSELVISQASLWGNTSTDGTSGTLEVWKDTTASGSAVYSAAIASGTGDKTGADTAPSSEAAATFSTSESIIVRVVSVGKVVDDLNVVIDGYYSDA